MKRKFQIPVLFLACGTLIFSGSGALAKDNGKGKGNKHKQYSSAGYNPEQGKSQEKGKKDKSYKAAKGNGNSKKFPHTTPHSFKVPPGHYPPAGYYRIWYSGRPPGQQPAPVRYGMPNNAPITPDAFIIYGDQAYDTQYDWSKVEAQKKKSVPQQVIDILLGSGVTTPAQ